MQKFLETPPGSQPMVLNPDGRLRPKASMQPIHGDHPAANAAEEFSGRGIYLITEETHPALVKEAEEMSARAGIATPQLFLAETNVPNAAAVSKHSIVLTTGLLNTLPFEKVVPILGHEIAHVKDYNKIVVLQGILPFITGIAGFIGARKTKWFGDTLEKHWFKRSLRFIGSAITGLGTRFLTKIAAIWKTELDADRIGSQISLRPREFQSALHELDFEGDNLLDKARRIKTGYPSMDKRIEKVEPVALELEKNVLANVAPPNTRIAPDSQTTEQALSAVQQQVTV